MGAKHLTYVKDRTNLWEHIPLRTPYSLQIEATFACNFRCVYCEHSKPIEEIEKLHARKAAPMEWDTFMSVVEQAKRFPDPLKKITFAGFGEPLLNPRLPEMIRVVRESNICDKTLVITNASLLTPELTDRLLESGLSDLKVSLQGMSNEKYQQICGAKIDLDTIYRNLQYFYQHRGNTTLRIKIADIALENGEEAQFYSRFGDICDYIAVEHIIPMFSGVHYPQNEGSGNSNITEYGTPFQKTGICSPLFYMMLILQNGDISFGRTDRMTYQGFNVKNISLWDAWNSKELRTMLYDQISGRLSRHPECQRCTWWDHCSKPEDILDGHEEEILSRMCPKEWDFSEEPLRREIMECCNN